MEFQDGRYLCLGQLFTKFYKVNVKYRIVYLEALVYHKALL